MYSDPLAYFITWTCYGTWLPGCIARFGDGIFMRLTAVQIIATPL